MKDLKEIASFIEQEDYSKALGELKTFDPPRMVKSDCKELEMLAAKIPIKLIAADATACVTMYLLARRKDDLPEMRRWHGYLTALRASKKEGTHDWAETSVLLNSTSLTMPGNDNARLLLLVSVINNDICTYHLKVRPLCATARRPSTLRGFNDISELGKNYRAVASILRPMVSGGLVDDEGHGVVETAIAELLYEKNDLNGASLELAGALYAHNPEILMTAYGLMARIGRVDPGARQPEELLLRLETILSGEDAQYLLADFKALKVDFDIHAGRLELVQEWLDTLAPDELESCTLADSYQLMTKGKAYIALGRYRDAVTLLEQLIQLLRREFRPLDTIECLAHCAVACDLLGSGNLAMKKLEEALVLACPYGYIRVFADCGRAMFQLISLYSRDQHPANIPHAYLKKVADAAKGYSMRSPALYARGMVEEQQEAAPELTSTELHILQLMDDGKSNKEIAATLGNKLPTVKFHITNIFEKLEVSSRVNAINKAKKLKII